jgi:hypothetical protein
VPTRRQEMIRVLILIFGRAEPLRVSAVIIRGSPFATVRDRTSGADPGGSDRYSGTDPVLTRHPARRKTRRDFRPIRSASGGVGRPRG